MMYYTWSVRQDAPQRKDQGMATRYEYVKVLTQTTDRSAMDKAAKTSLNWVDVLRLRDLISDLKHLPKIGMKPVYSGGSFRHAKNGWAITIPQAAQNIETVLHELSHYVEWTRNGKTLSSDNHGPEFVKTLDELIAYTDRRFTVTPIPTRKTADPSKVAERVARNRTRVNENRKKEEK